MGPFPMIREPALPGGQLLHHTAEKRGRETKTLKTPSSNPAGSDLKPSQSAWRPSSCQDDHGSHPTQPLTLQTSTSLSPFLVELSWLPWAPGSASQTKCAGLPLHGGCVCVRTGAGLWRRQTREARIPAWSAASRQAPGGDSPSLPVKWGG